MASDPLSAAFAISPDDSRQRQTPWPAICGVAVLAAALAMFLVNTQLDLKPYIGAIGGGLLITWGMVYVARHREWLVFALVMVEAILSTNYLPLPSSLRPAARYPLLFMLCLPAIPFTVRSGILKRGEFKHLSIYFAFALLSTAWSLIPTFSFGRALGAIAAYCAICAVALEVKDKADLDRILWHFMLATGLAVLLLPLSIVVFPPDMVWLPDLGIVRFRGMYDSPNQVGELMLSGASAGMLCWGSLKGLKRVFAAGTVGLAIFFALLADSRTSVVAIVVGIFAYILWRYRFKGVALACVAGVLLIAGMTALGKDYHDYINRGGQLSTLTGRTDIWHYAIKKIEERPFIGYGYEVEGELFKGHDFTIWWGPWDMGPRSSLHNGYISRAVSLGLPGLLFWLFIILRPWVWLFRRRGDPMNLKPVFWLGIVPILMLMLTETAVGDCRYTIGIFMFLMWAVAERQRLAYLDYHVAKRQQDATQRAATTPVLAAVMGG